MSELHVPTHNMDQFFYHKDVKVLSAEASTLGSLLYGRMYDDACDVGFAIYSPKTGRTECFYLEDIETDRENEIQLWVFKPVKQELGSLVVKVFND